MFNRRPPTDPDDIAANRLGRVTAYQRALVRSPVWFGRSQGLIVAVVALLVLAIIAARLIEVMPESGGVIFIGGAMAIVAAALFAPVLWNAVRVFRIRREMDEGRIEEGQGEVVWKRGNYVAEVGGRRLRPVRGDGLNLLCGPYRFYYLPQTGALLSAEPLASWERRQAIAELQQALAQTNHFSLDSLEANRRGELATDQAARMTFGAALRLLGGLAIFVFVGWVVRGYTAAARPSDPLTVLLCITGFGVASGLYLFYRSALIAADVWGGRIAAEDGRVGKFISGGRYTSYHYWIGGRRHTVSRSAYNALVEDILYRVYYLPRSRMLVGIEPLA